MALPERPPKVTKITMAKTANGVKEANTTKVLTQLDSDIAVRPASQQSVPGPSPGPPPSPPPSPPPPPPPPPTPPSPRPPTKQKALVSLCPPSAPSCLTQSPTSASKDLKPISEADIENVERPATLISLDEASQLRSTLAIGQLIASNRPTAGSRLIASELSYLSRTVKEESVALRKEICGLSESIASALKSALAEEREERNQFSLQRRPVFGQLPFRRFPIYSTRPRRPSIMLARKSAAVQTATTSPVALQSPSHPSAAISANSQRPASPGQQQQPAQQGQIRATKNTVTQASGQHEPQQAAAKVTSPVDRLRNLMNAIRHNWLPDDHSSSSYEAEADSESTDSSP